MLEDSRSLFNSGSKLSFQGFDVMSVLEKFFTDKIVADIIDEAPGKVLKVSYPSGVSAEGVELTPTQVKDEPKVEWEAEDGFYTLLLTGDLTNIIKIDI